MRLHRYYIKNYKKTTSAILFSIILTIALTVCIFAIKATDDHMEALKYEYMNGAQDFSVKELSLKQVEQLKKNPAISHLALSCYEETIVGKEKQNASIYNANGDFILGTSKLISGRLPRNSEEIVAEKWVLENLNIEPAINSKLFLKKAINPEKMTRFKQEQYKLVGIISDKPLNKLNSTIELYTAFTKKNVTEGDIYADIKLKSGINVRTKVSEIKKELGIEKSNIVINPYIEPTKSILEMDKIQIFLVAMLLVISAIIILGIYRIAILNRKSQYGILKAIGMNNHKIFRLIFFELFYLYMISIPAGILLGLICTYTMSRLSHDSNVSLIFWGEEVPIQFSIPVIPITVTIVGLGIIIWGIAIVSAYSLNKKPIIETISGGLDSKRKNTKISFLHLEHKLLKPYQKIAFKYIISERKTSLFIIISISIACSLFVGLYEKAKWTQQCNYYIKQQNFLNSDFRIEKINDESAKTGLTENTVQRVEKLDCIKDIDTQMLLPIRIIDNGVVKRNKVYCKEVNEVYKNTYIKSYTGNDGTDCYYKTVLRGYNETALKKLKFYVSEGKFDSENLKGNNIILWIPKAKGEDSAEPIEGYAKNGANVFQYRVGDKIEIKYRTNFNTAAKKCIQGKDKADLYSTHKFKVVAIVYFPYMEDVLMTTRYYPNIILTEKQFKDIFHLNHYSTINVNVQDNISIEQLSDVESKVVSFALRDGSAIAKNIRNERMDLEHLYYKQNIYGFGIAVVVLYLALMNVINNMKYRIEVRKKEINIYRAIGMNNSIVRKMVRFENLILGCFSIFLTIILSYPITYFIYQHTNADYFNIEYKLNMTVIGIVSIAVQIIIWILSDLLVKKLTKSSIVVNINNIE